MYREICISKLDGTRIRIVDNTVFVWVSLFDSDDANTQIAVFDDCPLVTTQYSMITEGNRH